MMIKKPVLSIFADGVRYDSLQYMPFLKTLVSTPLETVLGYSITCHPSMYTGVYPDKHKIAFHWVKGEKKNGPYTFLSYFPDFFPFSNAYFQALASHYYAKLFLKKKASPFMGYGKLLNLPMKFWNQIDINEFKYWDDDNYISEDIKTIFELARQNDFKYHVSNMHKPNLGKLHAVKTVDPKNYDWVYYFIGESDHVSHEFEQQFPAALRPKEGLWIALYDERLSTSTVESFVDETVDISRRSAKEKGITDKLAAHVILHSALDYMQLSDTK